MRRPDTAGHFNDSKGYAMECVLAARSESEQKHSTADRYIVRLARNDGEIREAQRLRYRVFADEFGARLPQRLDGHDIDHFDAHCDHLIVRDRHADRVVGTYRILAPEAARRIGSYYAEGEFYLNRLAHLREQIVEIGRSCIHPDYRGGAVIALLWAGLADYMAQRNHGYLMGCASIPMADGGHNAANLFAGLDAERFAPVEYRVFPRHRLPHERLANGVPARVPALLKGYLRAGAWVCGEPAWDPDFNSADLLILLPMSRLAVRHQRHFVKAAA